MDRFESSTAHLLAELQRMDLLIQAQVTRMRRNDELDERFAGLCVTDAQADELLARPVGLPGWAEDPANRATAEAELAEAIESRKRGSAASGVELRLEQLRARFGLGDFDVEVLLVCLGPELDLRYERLYAYLQDDVTRRHPSVDLVLNLLCGSLEEKLAARGRFEHDAPLQQRGLLRVFADPSHPEAPLLSRSCRVEDRVVAYLLGSDAPDASLLPQVGLSRPEVALDSLVLADATRERLAALWAGAAGRSEGVLYLEGDRGVGKRSLARALCSRSGVPLLEVDGRTLAARDAASFDRTLPLLQREVLLQGAALYWDGFEQLLAQGHEQHRRQLLATLGALPGWSFVAGRGRWEPPTGDGGVPFVRVSLPRPGSAERRALWRQSLNGDATVAEPQLDGLANRFRLSGGQIGDAVATARALAALDGDPSTPSAVHLDEACRRHASTELAQLARRVPPVYGWDDLIVPAEREEQLRDICARVRHRSRVYEDWGFGRALAHGTGTSVLLAGPPGTGKTMAAQVIAGDLGLELYAIDLASVVSKYIGETEKNLARIFDAAESSSAVLFFDEADALFGKRSEVRDARDRYANIEVSYLLQRMEQYEGVAILATNMRGNLDAAFLRRLAFVVSLPLPDEPARRRLWELSWPIETPRADDLDVAALARRYPFSGGHIRNVALSSAFLAADHDRPVGMDHVRLAARREQRNLGRVGAGSADADRARDSGASTGGRG